MSKRQTSQRRTRLWQDSERTAGSFFCRVRLKKTNTNNITNNITNNQTFFHNTPASAKTASFVFRRQIQNLSDIAQFAQRGLSVKSIIFVIACGICKKMPQGKRLLSYQRQPTAVQSLTANALLKNVVAHSKQQTSNS